MASEYARISITLPHAELDAADRLAAAQDRSRSWIIAEAIRRYAAESEGERESAADMGATRRIQIGRDLSLTAAQRVHEAEQVARVDAASTALPEQPLRFTSYAEFAKWRESRQGRP